MYPDERRFDTFLAASEEVARLAGAVGFPKVPGPARVREIAERLDESRSDLLALEGEWNRLFGASRTDFCYPNAGAFGDPENAGFLLATLQRAYAEVGLTPSSRDYLPDHVVVELEYLSFLCARLADGTLDARARADLEDKARRFLEGHFLAWVPKMCAQLDQVAEVPLYPGVARLALDTASDHLNALRAG